MVKHWGNSHQLQLPTFRLNIKKTFQCCTRASVTQDVAFACLEVLKILLDKSTAGRNHLVLMIQGIVMFRESLQSSSNPNPCLLQIQQYCAAQGLVKFWICPRMVSTNLVDTSLHRWLHQFFGNAALYLVAVHSVLLCALILL